MRADCVDMYVCVNVRGECPLFLETGIDLDLDLDPVTKALKEGNVDTGNGAARANHRH